MVRANVYEDREATMARFLQGLNRDIANIVELQHYVEVEEMVHMAMKVERQLKRRGTMSRYGSNSGSTSSWKSTWGKKDEKTPFKPKAEGTKPKEGGSSHDKGKSEKSQKRNRDIKCFKCLGRGHISSQCPNKRVMILREDGDVETEGESDDDEMPPLEDASDVEVAYPVDGRLLVARRALSVQVKKGDEV